MPQIREQIAMVHLPPSKTLKYLFHVRKTAASCRSQDAHLIVMGCAVFAPASEADVFCQRIPGCAWTHIAFQVRPFLLPVCSHSKTGIFLSMHPN